MGFTKVDELVPLHVWNLSGKVLSYPGGVYPKSFCSLSLTCVDRTCRDVLDDVTGIAKRFDNNLYRLDRFPVHHLSRSNQRVDMVWNRASAKNIAPDTNSGYANDSACNHVRAFIALEVSFD